MTGDELEALTKPQLRSLLLEHNVELPPTNARKAILVEMAQKALSTAAITASNTVNVETDSKRGRTTGRKKKTQKDEAEQDQNQSEQVERKVGASSKGIVFIDRNGNESNLSPNTQAALQEQQQEKKKKLTEEERFSDENPFQSGSDTETNPTRKLLRTGRKSKSREKGKRSKSKERDTTPKSNVRNRETSPFVERLVKSGLTPLKINDEDRIIEERTRISPTSMKQSTRLLPSPTKAKKSKQRMIEFISMTAFVALLGLILIRFYFPLPFCNTAVATTTTTKSKTKNDEVNLDQDQKLCIKCPDNAICEKGQLQCNEGYYKVRGLISDYCELDKRHLTRIEYLMDLIKQKLESQAGKKQFLTEKECLNVVIPWKKV